MHEDERAHRHDHVLVAADGEMAGDAPHPHEVVDESPDRLAERVAGRCILEVESGGGVEQAVDGHVHDGLTGVSGPCTIAQIRVTDEVPRRQDSTGSCRDGQVPASVRKDPARVWSWPAVRRIVRSRDGSETSMAHRVVTLLMPGANPFEFAVSCEVFDLRRPELDVEWYDHRLAVVTRPLVVNGGWTVDSPHGLEALEDADTVVVPACPMDPPPVAVAALRDAYQRGCRMVSFCSGAFALAAAGILDGRSATTHWMYAEELARRHPKVRFDPDVLYVDDGQVLTSAGTAGGIDLALHIVRSDHGADVANQVARRMVVAPHREGGQSQYVSHPVPEAPHRDGIRPLLEWLHDNLERPVSVEDLARLAAMSPRTLARRFRDATGTTPMRWLVHARVMRAQHLLETTDLPVEMIAHRVGLGTAANLRMHFRSATSMSPIAYRQRYRLLAS